MSTTWTKEAWEDYLYWQSIDKKILKKINHIMKDMIRHPFDEIGNPEALQHDLQGFWSRRIDREHRLVYIYEHKSLNIVLCCYHY